MEREPETAFVEASSEVVSERAARARFYASVAALNVLVPGALVVDAQAPPDVAYRAAPKASSVPAVTIRVQGEDLFVLIAFSMGCFAWLFLTMWLMGSTVGYVLSAPPFAVMLWLMVRGAPLALRSDGQQLVARWWWRRIEIRDVMEVRAVHGARPPPLLQVRNESDMWLLSPRPDAAVESIARVLSDHLAWRAAHEREAREAAQ
ncbi:MAG: hypothetical protein J0L92_07560 [Deltaproteobacteria bacterium]|nr:hypothetical protein [Deltaproteobacteria bacterium]